MLIYQAIFSTAWNYLKSKPSYNSLCSLALPPAKAGGSHQNTCWLCGNRWLYENWWVGAAGPPKYSTPWLVWTPINFLPIISKWNSKFCWFNEFSINNAKLLNQFSSQRMILNSATSCHEQKTYLLLTFLLHNLFLDLHREKSI